MCATTTAGLGRMGLPKGLKDSKNVVLGRKYYNLNGTGGPEALTFGSLDPLELVFIEMG